MLRLAQLTDLHLRWHQAGTSDSPRRLSRLMPELLAEALDRLIAAGVDLVALTGDLLDVPEAGREPEAIEADYRLLRSLLDTSGLAYSVLPGNHDSAADMARVWPDQARSLTRGGYRIHSFWDCEGAEHVPFRPTEERQRFVAALAEPVPQIHLQHYLLAPDLPDAGWPYNYQEAAELRADLAAAGRVVLCLAGHYHAGLAPTCLAGTTYATGPALAVAPHRYRIYTVDGTAVTLVEDALR